MAGRPCAGGIGGERSTPMPVRSAPHPSSRSPGQAEARYFPNWLFQITGSGANLSTISGLGPDIDSKAFSLRLLLPGDPSLSAHPKSRRTHLSIAAGVQHLASDARAGGRRHRQARRSRWPVQPDRHRGRRKRGGRRRPRAGRVVHAGRCAFPRAERPADGPRQPAIRPCARATNLCDRVRCDSGPCGGRRDDAAVAFRAAAGLARRCGLRVAGRR